MAAPTPDEVHTLLTQMSQPQFVNQATQYLLAYLKNPACVPTLFDILVGSPSPFVRPALSPSFSLSVTLLSSGPTNRRCPFKKEAQKALEFSRTSSN